MHTRSFALSLSFFLTHTHAYTWNGEHDPCGTLDRRERHHIIIFNLPHGVRRTTLLVIIFPYTIFEEIEKPRTHDRWFCNLMLYLRPKNKRMRKRIAFFFSTKTRFSTKRFCWLFEIKTVAARLFWFHPTMARAAERTVLFGVKPKNNNSNRYIMRIICLFFCRLNCIQ